MTDTERRMMESLGLTEEDFRPNPVSDSDRIAELEAIIQEQDEALMELAMMITEGE